MTTITTEAAAYLALSHCAEQMGKENFAKLPDNTRARMAKHRHGRRVWFPTNWPTPAHNEVCDAMRAVMVGEMDVESAMALLHRSDVQKERYGR